jgi:hypothetical protein
VMDFTPVENVPHVSVQVHSGIIGSGIRGVFDRIVSSSRKGEKHRVVLSGDSIF